jgi:benzil reductase ((S)-benzoin forming)
MDTPTPPSTAAIVTGHSRGLGAAIADDLLARGVAVLGISRSSRRTAARGLVEEQVDLSNEAELQSWLSGDAMARFLDGVAQPILVNNAGLLQPIGRLEQQDPVAVSRAVSVNVGAVLALSAAFARITHAARDRRILHVSSGAARSAYAGWSVYCATKAALDHHARAVVLDRSRGLRIASVAPGVIDTDMQAEIRETPADSFPDRERFVEMKREGSLRSPADAAKSLVDHLLSSDFGADPVTETRR